MTNETRRVMIEGVETTVYAGAFSHLPTVQDSAAASPSPPAGGGSRWRSILSKDERIAALEKALDALIIESGGQAIPNTNLTIAREQAIRVRATPAKEAER